MALQALQRLRSRPAPSLDPASHLVMVHTAVRKLPVDPGGREAVALWRGIVKELGS